MTMNIKPTSGNVTRREPGLGQLISFVIPVMNESPTIAELYDGIAANVPKTEDFEVIFVDDGSTDHTWAVIQTLAETHPKHVRGLKFRGNRGKAAALTAGFQAAQGEVVFTMDGDLQDDPKEIPRFLSKLKEGYGLVSGWKKIRHDPWHKVLPSRIFNRMLSFVGGVRLHDHNCGFKCYQASLAKSLLLHGELHRMVPSLASIHGYLVSEIPVTHHPRKYGQSKYGIERFMRGFSDMLTIGFQRRFGERPSHLFNGIGLTFFTAALAIGVYAIPYMSRSEHAFYMIQTIAVFMASGIASFAAGQISEMILQVGISNKFGSHIVLDTASRTSHIQEKTSSLESDRYQSLRRLKSQPTKRKRVIGDRLESFDLPQSAEAGRIS